MLFILYCMLHNIFIICLIHVHSILCVICFVRSITVTFTLLATASGLPQANFNVEEMWVINDLWLFVFHGFKTWRKCIKCENQSVYLLLLVSSSVPRLQNRLGFGAARGRHSIMTCPPLAAGISFLTGFSLKSGAWTGRREGKDGVRILAPKQDDWQTRYRREDG